MYFNIQPSKKIAVITSESAYTYTQLLELASQFTFNSEKKQLILLLCDNTILTITAYISALQQGHAVMLMSSNTNTELLISIINKYHPKWIIGYNQFDGYMANQKILERKLDIETVIHPDLAVLLSTSGTTGSQKFVRLSYTNLQSNAESIVEYLQITDEERGILNLPLSYSYGMSILNSHLQVQATILLTEQSVMEKSFWSFVHEHRATSLAGVPFTYQMLSRIGFFKMDLPFLKTLTQAGGRLNEKLVKNFAEYAHEHNKRFYVMYGQTEAAPRISYIPPKSVLDKTGSIGIAIPGGELTVDSETSELIYKGPNVMMGYATCLKDLENGNELQGVLHTGDTAEVDKDGYFTITGRMKRFIKLFGLRINLDDVERKLESAFNLPIACTGNDDKLIVAIEEEQLIDVIKREIEEVYKLHKTSYKVVVLSEIPRFLNGKIDYGKLKEQCL